MANHCRSVVLVSVKNGLTWLERAMGFLVAAMCRMIVVFGMPLWHARERNVWRSSWAMSATGHHGGVKGVYVPRLVFMKACEKHLISTAALVVGEISWVAHTAQSHSKQLAESDDFVVQVGPYDLKA
ncbi:hypothetical protein H257_06873 [Aphanomyces astaci]|uniref:Uncharacterized protein n=1 Tax=Aphanomyces astaci TaxID=112090 RepID=W4GIW9_APHAT|nr:hypothetical protein H257_06870 [Aphanomyces astaci]XP_009830549.1 hypothetical protein H257_06873 [Aphanomyces astaci]ETV79612.1 hypothetical protein H257_06870 [Aphanomyces astaci]ETV79613.1 hypothetical protein H257_06873 [Aphanomyces astaci]|eukprot:XP_009830548.1 hypothetical protein H257_06870 [Aphanomyces astaci]